MGKTRGRGSIVQRGEGRWLVRVFRGIDPGTGKRQYHNETVRGTKSDAKRALTKVLGQSDNNTLPKASRETVSEYLDRWLSTMVAHNVRPHCLSDYRFLADHYIKPYLGAIQLRRLTVGEIQERMVHALQERGLSSRTIGLAHGLLSSALRDAVRLGLLSANPASNSKLPRAKPVRERLALSPEEVARLREATKGTPQHVLFGFLIDSGCRPSEALALHRDDLDLEAGTVTIRRSLSKGAKGLKKQFQDPKTEQGKRIIVLSPSTVRELRAHLAAQAAERLAAGPAYNDLGLVFAGPTGAWLDSRNINARHLKRAVKAAGLDSRITLYCLRHTCASALTSAGVALNHVSARLGHKDATTTLRYYVHPATGGQAIAAAQMEKILSGQG